MSDGVVIYVIESRICNVVGLTNVARATPVIIEISMQTRMAYYILRN